MALPRLKCAILLAGAAVFAIGSAPAGAEGIRPAKQGVSQTVGTSDATDFSSQRRRGGRYYRRRGYGPGPGLAVGALAAGVIGSAIAASQPRHYYDDGYYAAPGYYGGPGYGYGGGYGGGYYDDGGW